MTNKELIRVGRLVARRAKKWPYDFWTKLNYPLDFQMVVNGEELGIEIDIDTLTNASIQLAIFVDDGCPPSVIIPPFVRVEITNELLPALPEGVIDL